MYPYSRLGSRISPGDLVTVWSPMKKPLLGFFWFPEEAEDDWEGLKPIGIPFLNCFNLESNFVNPGWTLPLWKPEEWK